MHCRVAARICHRHAPVSTAQRTAHARMTAGGGRGQLCNRQWSKCQLGDTRQQHRSKWPGQQSSTRSWAWRMRERRLQRFAFVACAGHAVGVDPTRASTSRGPSACCCLGVRSYVQGLIRFGLRHETAAPRGPPPALSANRDANHTVGRNQVGIMTSSNIMLLSVAVQRTTLVCLADVSLAFSDGSSAPTVMLQGMCTGWLASFAGTHAKLLAIVQ